MSTKNVFYFQGLERSRYAEDLFHDLVRPIEKKLSRESYFEIFIREIHAHSTLRYSVHVNLVLSSGRVLSSLTSTSVLELYPTIRKGLFSAVAKIRAQYRFKQRSGVGKTQLGDVTSFHKFGINVSNTH